MAKKLRVGIIGSGNIADPYTRNLLTYPEVIELVGYADLDPERDIGCGITHPVQTFDQPRMPKAQFAADCQNRSPSGRHGDLMSGSLP